MTTGNQNKMKKTYFQRRPWYVPLAIALLVFSFLIATQYNTQQKVLVSLENQKTEDLVALVRNLNEKRSTLEKELEDLTLLYHSLGVTATVENQLKQLEVFIGAVPVTGPGITITITGDSPLVYLDLVDLVNELKVTGAEAIAINDIRVQNSTRIAQGIDTNGQFIITINGEKLLAPVIIKAIGKPETLESGLTFPGGIIDSLNNHYNVFPTIKKEERLHIPAISGAQYPQYMKKYDGPLETAVDDNKDKTKKTE